MIKVNQQSNHIKNILVNICSSITPVSSLWNWLSHPRHQGVGGSCQLEGINEFSDLFKVGTQSGDLIDHIFQTNNISTDVFLNEFVGVDLDSFVADFSIHFLVNEFLDHLEWGFSIGNVVLHSLQLPQSGRRAFQEHSWVNTFQAQSVEDSFLLFRNVLHTSDSDGDDQLLVSLAVFSYSWLHHPLGFVLKICIRLLGRSILLDEFLRVLHSTLFFSSLGFETKFAFDFVLNGFLIFPPLLHDILKDILFVSLGFHCW